VTYRHLSLSIVPKRNVLAVNLTVSSFYAMEKANGVRHL
jgi:hypothetical protein